MSGKSNSNKSIISDSNSSPATLTPDLLSELKKFVQPPTETASIKLFAIFLDKYSTQSPRDCSFALDEFIQKSPENMQLYIDTVYNTIPSSTEQNRAMKILKKQVIPTYSSCSRLICKVFIGCLLALAILLLFAYIYIILIEHFSFTI